MKLQPTYQQRKLMKPKTSCLHINKSDKTLARLTKTVRQKTQLLISEVEKRPSVLITWILKG